MNIIQQFIRKKCKNVIFNYCVMYGNYCDTFMVYTP